MLHYLTATGSELPAGGMGGSILMLVVMFGMLVLPDRAGNMPCGTKPAGHAITGFADYLPVKTAMRASIAAASKP